MNVLYDRACASVPADTLMVLLPGAYMTSGDFVKGGFIAAVRKRGLPMDMAVADAHVGHVADGSALTHLCNAIVRPARAAGYQHIGLVGISLGGLLAITYADHHADPATSAIGAAPVDSLCLLSPYPGPRPLTNEIKKAGGLHHWQPGEVAVDDVDRRAWRWLQRHGIHRSGRVPTAPVVYLGYGSEDRFAASHRMMAEVLPPGQVDVLPGGHDWPVWSALWERFLETA